MTIWKKDECILLLVASEKIYCRRSRRVFLTRLELESVLQGLSERASEDMGRKETTKRSTDTRILIDNTS